MTVVGQDPGAQLVAEVQGVRSVCQDQRVISVCRDRMHLLLRKALPVCEVLQVTWDLSENQEILVERADKDSLVKEARPAQSENRGSRDYLVSGSKHI